MAVNKKWGAWIPACAGHVACIQKIYNSNNFEVPMESGNQLTTVIEKWFNDLNTSSTY